MYTLTPERRNIHHCSAASVAAASVAAAPVAAVPVAVSAGGMPTLDSSTAPSRDPVVTGPISLFWVRRYPRSKSKSQFMVMVVASLTSFTFLGFGLPRFERRKP